MSRLVFACLAQMGKCCPTVEPSLCRIMFISSDTHGTYFHCDGTLWEDIMAEEEYLTMLLGKLLVLLLVTLVGVGDARFSFWDV